MAPKNKLLDRQLSPQDPVFLVLQGMTMRLEGTLDLLDIAKEGAPKAMLEWVDECRAFIDELAVAKMYQPMVLKVQRPLETNSPEPLVLVYNEDRTLYSQLTMDDPSLMSMFGDDYKMFVRARLWVNGALQLIARTEDQSW